MSQRERENAVIERVGKNLKGQRIIDYGSLEMQSSWSRWRENVLTLDMSWNSLFNMGDPMVGVLQRAEDMEPLLPHQLLFLYNVS
jgi:hypothetical protein